MLSNSVVIGEHVEFIYCGCGCKKTRPLYYFYNGKKKKRKFIQGHSGHKFRDGYKPKKESIEKQKQTLQKYYSTRHGITWKGGLTFHKDTGYYVYQYRGFRSLYHRIVYEEYNKVCLLSWGIVHHKDGNKKNNDPLNLEGMFQSEHCKLHGFGNIHRGTRKKKCD